MHAWRVVGSWVALAAASLTFAAPAWAESAAKTGGYGGQHHFGVGAQIGFYQPNGIAFHVGTRAIALEASAGYMFQILTYTTQGGEEVFYERKSHVEVLFPLQAGADLMVRVYEGPRELDAGLQLSYRFNEFYGSGFGGGGYVTKRVSRAVQLHGTFGVGIFPSAEDKLRGDQVPENADFLFPPPSVYWGFSGGVFLFP